MHAGTTLNLVANVTMASRGANARYHNSGRSGANREGYWLVAGAAGEGGELYALRRVRGAGAHDFSIRVPPKAVVGSCFAISVWFLSDSLIGTDVTVAVNFDVVG